MELAERLGGTVINADSMQVYADVPIVTAQPSAADRARAPHALYGVRNAAKPGNVAWWREEALVGMDAALALGRVPILCGGTGLYLSALVQGLSPMPPADAASRAEARGLLAAEGPLALHARLLAVDPATPLRPSDGQRLARAWEVWRVTGRTLGEWQALKGEAAPYAFRMVLLDPPRAALRAASRDRFGAMVKDGAVREVSALLARGLDWALPAMRAHGVPELAGHLAGRTSLAEATERVVLATGQYMKRQATWFRHRPPVAGVHTHTIHARFAGSKQFSESEWACIESFISGRADEPGPGERLP